MEIGNWKLTSSLKLRSLKMVLAVTVLGLGLQSCKEIIATNISETVPVMILPQVNDTVNNNPVHFKWEEIEGATKYHLQIVSTSFSNIQNYAVDSMVTSESIFISLDSNEYELMLTAINEGYTSHTLGPVKFWVGVQPSETSGFVTLISPADGAYFNEDYAEDPDFQSEFDWSPLTGADSYEFSLRRGPSYASGEVVETLPGIETTTHDVNEILIQGEYYWGVRANLTSGEETAIALRKFYIDTVNPGTPTLVSPSSSVQTGSVVFTWTNPTDTGSPKSPVHSTVEVAEDINFTLNLESADFTGTTGTMTLEGIGQRYWRVINWDEAGNFSSYSTVGEFTLTL